MAVLQMQRFSICALKKDRKAILEKLQALGVMEIDNSVIEDDSLQKMDTVESRQVFEKQAVMAEHALDVLQKYVPEKTSMLSSLEGKKQVNRWEYEKIVQNRDVMSKRARELVNLNKEISENNANVVKLENQIESLAPWMSLEVPMTYRGTRSAAFLVGTMSRAMTMEEIRTAVAEHAPDLDAYDVTILSADKDLTYLAVVCLRKDADKLEDALRASGFARPSQMVSKVPSELKKNLEEQIQQLNSKTKQIESQIAEYKDYRNDLRLFVDYYRIRAEKYQILGQIPQSKQTFFISGYVPEGAVPLLKEKIENAYNCTVDVEEIKEEEEPPVLLKNGKISSSVEGVLESYGLPHKGEVDPTRIMSVFYIVLFGMMLSDAAYGLLVSLVCFIALKKFPRMAEGLAKSIRLFMYCGISTLIWGVLFGGYFGNVVDIVSEVYFGHKVVIPALWFVPLNNPMKLLIFSLGLGIVHLFFGLGIKGYSYIKNKDYMGFLCDVVFWYMLLVGLLLMLIPSDLFASIAQAKIVFPPFVNLLAKVLAIGGAVGLLLFAARDNKNFGLRLALGAYELYNITGWLSDVLSYSRLLALGLATGVIASVVNQMGSMMGTSIIGVIGFIVVFIVGHTLNLAINLLGAYVHTNRLQFVEFFGKFYEGGGRPFNPFKQNTKYVDIKEEN
ncbi:MAG: V-type ATP synthase subunit I [Lachnospiraceae bacterium]|nr:V-type ATP synthase subunit I [Lachnospiraceae bacterium]MDY4769957.1 V-type ATP synthase subunit I [Lachnospiraceae bacterium]